MALLHVSATEEQARSAFEEVGAARVRDMIAAGNQLSSRHTDYARAWLREKDQEAESRSTESTNRRAANEARQADAASRAAWAAEEQAFLARRADRKASIALIIAALAIAKDTIWPIISRWLSIH